MKQVRHYCYWVLAALLLCSVGEVSAVTLGRVHGIVVIGRPLELAVNVEFSADEDATPDLRAMCYGADIYFGDTQISSSNVQLQVAAGASAQTHNLRISTSKLIDEPTVSVTLRAGCAHKTVRRYVLLAEMLSDLVPDQTPAPAAAAGATPGNAKPAAVTAQASDAAPTSAAAVSPEPKAKVRRHKSASKGAHLKLVDSALEAAPAHTSKASRKADALAMEALEKRVDALDQWRETMPAADQTAQLQARVQAFEGDLKGLHALTLKNQQNLQAVAADLDRMQSGARDGNLALYALTAVLALCVAVVAWLVLRVRSAHGDSSPWWSVPAMGARAPSGADVDIDMDADAVPVSALARTAPSRVEKAAAAAEPAVDPTSVDIDIGIGAAAFAAMATDKPSAEPRAFRNSEKQDFALSSVTTLRSVNTKEMLDVRQQAEFFMALGQHDEAVKVLETSINQSHEANPLVILDLLKIFHTLGRRAEFDHYRQEFNAQFTGRVPAYTSFTVEGDGLESYEELCREITVLWPSDEAVDYIEQCLVRTVDDDPEQGLDLEAFRDLLMLHGVLKRLGSAQDSDLTPFSTVRNVAAPVASEPEAFVEPPAATGPGPLEFTPVVPPPEATVSGAVDLDLSEAPHDNLIDFDIDGFTLDTPLRPGSK